MNRKKRWQAAALICGLALIAQQALAHGDAHPKKADAPIVMEQKSWGIAAEPRAGLRTIRVSMNDTMRFVPSNIRVREGETVRLLVKNNVVCKLPRRDPVSALFYGRALLEVAGDGPVARSVSIAYWERDSQTERRILEASDAVCVWGGEKAVSEVKRKVGAGTRILEFGPKRSIALVDLTALQQGDSLHDVALRAASDLSVYNQEACFTAQELSVVGGDAFFEQFPHRAGARAAPFPAGSSQGSHPGRQQGPRAAHAQGAALLRRADLGTEDHGFTILVKRGEERLRSHPLARTVFVHRVAALDPLSSGPLPSCCWTENDPRCRWQCFKLFGIHQPTKEESD